MEHQTSSFVQVKVGTSRTDIHLLLQPRSTQRRHSGAHVAVRGHQRCRLAVSAPARRRLAVARTLPWLLVAWQRHCEQGRIHRRQSSITVTTTTGTGFLTGFVCTVE